MTTLMITPYAPYRDGIANYAVQEVAALRRAGTDVRVLSPLPSAAHEHLVIGSPVGMLRLLRRIVGPGRGRFDRVVVQFYPELLFGSCRNRLERLAVWWLLALLCTRVPVELRVHEIDYAAATTDDATSTAARKTLLAADAVTVHTEAERRRLAETFDLSPTDVRLADHGGNFARRTSVDRTEARDSLGIPTDAFIFLSIGFLQRHKGFDRGARALARIDHPGGDVRLYVVGDIRVEHPEVVAYRDELRTLIEGIDGAELRSGYVSDEEFDRWLVAADRLVLPYREIWSSSVMERAELYDVPVIATDVGGLADQAHPGSTIVADDDELATAMAEACGGTVSGTAAPFDDDEDLHGRADLEAAMARRAGTVPEGTRPETVGLGRVPRPAVDSARPGVPQVKRLISRVTSWQLDPVVRHVDDLTAKASHDFSELARRLDDLENPTRARADAPPPDA